MKGDRIEYLNLSSAVWVKETGSNGVYLIKTHRGHNKTESHRLGYITPQSQYKELTDVELGKPNGVSRRSIRQAPLNKSGRKCYGYITTLGISVSIGKAQHMKQAHHMKLIVNKCHACI